IHQDELNIAKLERENSASGIYDDRIAHLKAGKDKTIDELKHYEEQWEKEKQIILQIRELREKIEADFLRTQGGEQREITDEQLAQLKAEIRSKNHELA